MKFSKMHGLGNDFVIVNAIDQTFDLNAEQIKQLSDRHTGIGFDQLLVVDPAPNPDVDFGYRIFNADGGEVEQCGNGARCFAQFVRQQGLTDKKEMRAATKSGIVEMKVLDDGQVSVNMGAPSIDDQQIDIQYPHTIVSMGNPHIVLLVSEISTKEIETIGKDLQNNIAFRDGVNVGFVQHSNKNKIYLRVYERGVGETLACGSGACAAVVAGFHQGLLDADVQVILPGGSLNVHWSGGDQPVWLMGPVANVFDGEINN